MPLSSFLKCAQWGVFVATMASYVCDAAGDSSRGAAVLFSAPAVCDYFTPYTIFLLIQFD